MAKETNRIDIYQAVTDDILAMLEAGTKPWVKPWSGGPTIPLRHNGVAYRGINVLSLWASAMRQGFASPYWLTFKQALELGGNVRKGSKGTTVVYANKLVVKDSGDGRRARHSVPETIHGFQCRSGRGTGRQISRARSDHHQSRNPRR
jgi:antirestriction protein ArdC